MSKITVIKPFVFCTPGVERSFPVGAHEISDETANHPWIRAGADGHIEKAAEREKVEEKPDAKERKGR
jgi:hypothetical protein